MNGPLSHSQRSEKTRRMVQLALWSAIIVILSFTPFLGYIPVGPMYATTVHIPVIIGAIMLGPSAGAFLGLVFGITSIIQATIQVPLTAFMFSPFVPFGSIKSVFIAIVPRVLLGIFAGYTFRLVKRVDKTLVFAGLSAGIIGSMTNTIFVLGGVYFLFKDQYARQMKISVSMIGKVILGYVAVNGVVEALVAALIATAVTRALFTILKKTSHTTI